MRQFLRFKSTYIFSLLITSAFVSSCDKDMIVSLGKSDEDLSVSLMDSMEVHASTFQLNYLPSAGTGTVLVGQATTPAIGKVKSTSYLRLQFQELGLIPDGATFDSINVELKPNAIKYYYGDTTQTQSLSIHRVTEEIKAQNILTDIDNYKTPIYVTGATIFADKKFQYDNTPLGTTTFKPRVKSLDKISIKLENAFGQNLYNLIKNNDYQVSNSEQLQQYLKGIAIVPHATNSAILGLNDTVRMNINYSYTGTDGFKVSASKTLLTSSRLYQFNNIEYDRSGTDFAALSTTNRELKSNETNQNVLVQSGTGTVAKLNIPSLKEFMTAPDMAINKAELIIEVQNQPNMYGFPTAVTLMTSNKNLIPVSYIVTPFGTTIQQVNYITGNDVGLNGRYVFNLIEYVKNINTDQYRDASLLLSSASPNLFSNTNAFLIAKENGKPKIKLNIVYTKFK